MGLQVVLHTPSIVDKTMDQKKTEHILDNLFESGALQDVAYGTTTLRNDSGNKQSVCHAVLTALKSHVIQDCFAYCPDVARTTLWNILSALKPRQRRAIGGLDNTTANGLKGIDNLTKLLKDKHLNFEETGLLSDFFDLILFSKIHYDIR